MNAVLSLFRDLPRSLLLILALGAVLRVGVVLLHEQPLVSDERDYDRLAVSIATTGSYSENGLPTAYRPVGYPAFVGFVYFLAGHKPVVVKLFQALLDATVPLMLFLLLPVFERRTRILAAAFWAFYPPAVLYANLLLSESVFTFLLVLATLLLVRSDQFKVWAFLLIGVLFGVMALIKGVALIVLLLLPLAYLALRQPLRRVLWVGLGALLLVIPWTVRNSVTLGYVGLSTNVGMDLLIGNNPNANGSYTSQIPDEIFQGATSEAETNDRAFRYAVHYIIEKPGMFVVNGIRKAAHLVESEGGILIWSFSGSREDSSIRYASRYASLPVSAVLGVNLPYFILLMAGILGLLGFPEPRLRWLFLVVLAAWLLIHLLFFGGSRMHFPLMPFFALFAAWWFVNLPGSFLGLSASRKTFGLVVVAGLVAVWAFEAVLIYLV